MVVLIIKGNVHQQAETNPQKRFHFAPECSQTSLSLPPPSLPPPLSPFLPPRSPFVPLLSSTLPSLPPSRLFLQPLNYETASSYKLQIDARNPEPLVSGLEYGAESSAVVSVAISDVDEAPVFDMDILDVTVPEDTKEGATLLKIDAKDPEGKEIL